MKLIIASHNKGKIAELRTLLAPYFEQITSMAEEGLVVPVEETGITFFENAKIKAEYVMRATGAACIADDSGLCVRSLGGAPGVYSAR
ncbi:MAG: non-canonical purine NTP pyrophosphatase, partial [Clostridia bacterium]|nr:non-canonical purine NTP pyrophosphatase [Clostridia bacterium]